MSLDAKVICNNCTNEVVLTLALTPLVLGPVGSAVRESMCQR